MKNITSIIATLLLATGCILPANSEEGNTPNTDGGLDSGLPQCSPLGGASGQYCNTTDDGHCTTTICNCTDTLGHQLPTIVEPMVGYDGGCGD